MLQLSFFERLASGSPEQLTGASKTPFNGIDVGSYAAPAVADWDGDGDVNLVAWLYSSSNAGGNLIALLRDAGGNLIAHLLRRNPALNQHLPKGEWHNWSVRVLAVFSRNRPGRRRKE